jgi:glycosyltransferase involved in cell wall biosynthesis
MNSELKREAPKSKALPQVSAPGQVLYDSRATVESQPPEATLIIPVYNVAPYLEECLAGVFATTSSVRLEIIIVDDGSTDGSGKRVADLLAQYQPGGVLYLRQQNQGLSAVRNLGVSLANGDYIGFLDSDDLISVGAMRPMLDFAREHDCDVMLGRSVVFDSKSDSVTPFYDEWAWWRLLANSPSRVISRHEDAALFFLEPNANYRLVRRKFYLGNGLNYPVGKLFEDPPVHYKMLAMSARTGLLDITYYWYRVNRPGKITAERSQRRFDILNVAREVFGTLSNMNVTPDEGGAIIYGLTRIVWWCGTMTLPEQRRNYFEEACSTFRDYAPIAWVNRVGFLHFPDQILHLVLAALMRGEVNRLVRLSFGQRTPIKSIFFLIKIGRKDLVLKRLKEMSSRKFKKIRLILG